MVNELQVKRAMAVKVEESGGPIGATAKGGLSLLEAMARKTRLWSDCERLLPARRDRRQGFATSAVAAAVVHGLLAGGRGFCATEPMRGDAPLLAMIGLKRAPSAETVEEVVKYLGAHDRGHEGLSEATGRQCARMIKMEKRGDLLDADGFAFTWSDGSMLECEGKDFEAIKVMKGRRGQLVAGCFVGPYLAGSDFAGQGEGEQALAKALLLRAREHVLKPAGLLKAALVLLDSLHGDGPTLDLLEGEGMELDYIVGAGKLRAAEATLADQPAGAWRDAGARPGRGWAASGVIQCWIQCEGWRRKRLLVGRRWRKKGEMIWNYSGVVTSLTEKDPRVASKMKREGIGFEEAIWRLYSRKQAMENQWKELLSDLGLHHPPSAKVKANAVFFALGGLAYNLAVAARRLTLEGKGRAMRLWRFRRDVIDLAAAVARHARGAVVRLLDARREARARLVAAMLALGRL